MVKCETVEMPLLEADYELIVERPFSAAEYELIVETQLLEAKAGCS